ncbi:M23 family metallopeptidase [Actinoplanes sp. G11-F43]|uniref:M23 family metallopeptidase n=1 Tax=Actinoplanes sp. G11-F43 TaxID=3424130 RepID=UPI003D342172
MRQRLSSEPDRYRGRRRVPTPPRSRYAAVVTSAFVGAGVVALGAASNLPDSKTIDPEALQGLSHNSSVATEALENRSGEGAASRSEDRGANTELSAEVSAEEVYLLPLDDYEFTSGYGVRFGQLHAGIDLAAPDGTPYKAVHAGVVTQSGYNGGYGNSITVKQDDGTEIIYAHSRRVIPKVGEQVKAGQVIGEVGNTGFSYGYHLHLEVHVKGTPTDPITFLRDRGVDIKLNMESVYAGIAAAEAS